MSRLRELANILAHLEGLSDKTDASPLPSPLSLRIPGCTERFLSIREPETKTEDWVVDASNGSSELAQANDEKNRVRLQNPSDKSDERDGAWSTADLPAEWTAGVARLQTMSCPSMVRLDRWRQAIIDAGRFLDQWGAQSAALDWTTLNVFGVHPTHPIERLDCAGLIILLRGDELLAITAATARMRTSTGSVMTFCRGPQPGAVPLWELA